MVRKVSIENFKSIKQLSFDAKRVNVFIGEPNTGKSNLLEALGMFSLAYGDLGQIRYKETSDLFYNSEITDPVKIVAEFKWSHKTLTSLQNFEGTLQYANNEKYNFQIDVIDILDNNSYVKPSFSMEYIADRAGSSSITDGFDKVIKYYQFKVLDTFTESHANFLTPPFGNNLFHLLLTNKELKSMVSEILMGQGYRLGLRHKDKEIEIVKVVDDVFYTYPYQTISDTLQRLIFYTSVIETNRDSVILLEEPETNIFPYYTKYLAERMAMDESNQYFLVTHNPYFLMALVEKTKASDLAVFITYTEDYKTQLKRLTEEELSDLLDLDMDVFLNLDKFLVRESIH